MRETSKCETTKRGTIGAAFATLALLAASAASAQTTSLDKAPAEKQAPNSLQDSGGDNLSTKLSHSGGVITPKSDVDPGIGKSAPDPHPNSTPVIPPSATGGSSAK